jgi:phage tail sheath protein FI
MAYKHGVSVSEVPTSILPPVESASGIPFIVGTAPVYMTDPTNVNKPVLVHNYDEAVKAFGYVPPREQEDGTKKYDFTICEFIDSQFKLFGVGPAIIVNVLDIAGDFAGVSVNGTIAIKENGTGVVTDPAEESMPYLDASSFELNGVTKGVDYTVSYDENGRIVVTMLNGETSKSYQYTAQAVNFDSKESVSCVIGGVDENGKKTGLELISECFPRFRLTPSIILAPKFSQDPAVAAVMAAKAENISGVFSAISLVDVPTDEVKNYTAVAEWKNTNNITDKKQICCFPMCSLDGTLYHMSTQLAGLLGKTDADNDDVPYVSPSNKNFQMTAAVLADGTEVWLDTESAAYLNGQGVVTAINFIGGWKCWGNRTACYPAVTDVKDAFIPINRMFSWIGNTFIQTFWQNVDAPLNRRQIDTIVDSANIWLNGLTARQYILGGRVEFLETENPTTDLMDGKARFHVFITPPSPNREIDFVLEYDPEYLQTLFS